MKFGKAVLE